ncbi:histidine kinase [Vibrio sp. SCSIO 43132]|uniref:sensor histidine kinase n=1 Tax=Vibrio sp. SCSIO 43132 TaxID=2779363 RepID=UPI001CA8FF18|nr:ATP-binding protein [Vibrio sp. SCSIO 43132]UAB72185.1 histidine kinase [Vibrio sp. SCSIO 43132]
MKDENNPSETADHYKNAYYREKKIRKESEKLLESKSRELYESMTKLEETLANVQKLQDQMIHNEKMAAIGQLAAGVTHEINNPVSFALSNINQLNGYVREMIALDSLAMESLESDSGLEKYIEYRKSIDLDFIIPEFQEIIEDTIQGLNRIKEITINFKKASHKGTGVFAPVDMKDCIETALKVVNSEIKHTIDLKLSLNPVPDVNGSFTQLQQVFINLFVNAKHATLGKGSLSISTQTIDMGDNDWIKITVKDTGKGIKPDDLAHIFEPFFTTKEIGKGTGLGLSISYEIIKNHRGSIEVASEVDVGTTFTILLPGI